MEVTTTLVRVKELERILTSAHNHLPDVSVRYRTLGQVWYPNFLKIVAIEERKIVFYDNIRQSRVTLTDYTRIAELELNGKLEMYGDNVQYEVADDHDE